MQARSVQAQPLQLDLRVLKPPLWALVLLVLAVQPTLAKLTADAARKYTESTELAAAAGVWVLVALGLLLALLYVQALLGQRYTRLSWRQVWSLLAAGACAAVGSFFILFMLTAIILFVYPRWVVAPAAPVPLLAAVLALVTRASWRTVFALVAPGACAALGWAIVMVADPCVPATWQEWTVLVGAALLVLAATAMVARWAVRWARGPKQGAIVA